MGTQPVRPELTDTQKSVIKDIYVKAKEKVAKVLEDYGATREHLETRHLEAIDSILDAESTNEADQLAKKAEDKVFITCLSLATTGKILPNRPGYIEKRAKSAESFAKWMEKTGNEEAAAKSRAKAEKLLDKAKALREKIDIPALAKKVRKKRSKKS
jgi:hypothetical protein